MSIPNTARTRMISGLPGTISHDGPTRVTTSIIDSADETKNVFGAALTYKDDTKETVQAGGDGVFAGILVHPHAYAVDTDYAQNGTSVEHLSMGEAYVTLESLGKIGDSVAFTSAGALTTATSAGTLISGASVARHNTSAEQPRLAIIALNGYLPKE